MTPTLSPHSQSILASALAKIATMPSSKPKPRKEYAPVEGTLIEGGVEYIIYDMMARVRRVRIKPWVFWDHRGGDPEGFEFSVSQVPTATLYIKFLDGTLGIVRCSGTVEASAFILRVPWAAVEGPNG